MAVRLDLIKKILAAFWYEKDRFRVVDEEIEDIIEK